MILLLLILSYFVVGVVLFFSFWRWFAIEDDDVGNNVVSAMLLFCWPLTLSAFGFFILMSELWNLGQKVKKK